MEDCPHCHLKLGGAKDFCPHCGNSLSISRKGPVSFTDFALLIGQLASLLGCIGAVVGYPIAVLMWLSAGVCFLIPVGLLGAVIAFFYSLGMFVVFTHVRHTRRRNAE